MRSNNSRQSRIDVPDVGAIRNRHLKVLIVDDEAMFRESMSFNLKKKYAAAVTDVDSGAEAVQLLKAGGGFDVIFLDLWMPGMKGTDTYAELKKVDANCAIVMMSAHSDRNEWVEAGKLNVVLLAKPFPAYTLTQILFHVACR